MKRIVLIRLGGLMAMAGGVVYVVQGFLAPPLVRLLVPADAVQMTPALKEEGVPLEKIIPGGRIIEDINIVSFVLLLLGVMAVIAALHALQKELYGPGAWERYGLGALTSLMSLVGVALVLVGYLGDIRGLPYQVLAGLGLALRDSKRVAALALTGLVGFGLGVYLFFILGFIGLLPGWTSIAMGTGLFAGAMLGLPFGDWKSVAALGLAGLVAFGIGGAITATLRMPFVLLPFAVDFVELQQAPLLLLQHVLVQTMIGLIGGASLGAALGYLEKRRLAAEQRPRVR